MNHKKARFDLSRRKQELDELTLNFDRKMAKLDEYGYRLNADGICKLVNISHSALNRWIKEELIFPLVTKKSHRQFRYKDVLRAVTIKFLMSEGGMRKFMAIRLLLEMTNLALDYTREEACKTINNMRIDKFLMKVLNYDLEQVATWRMSNSNKRKEKKENDSLE